MCGECNWKIDAQKLVKAHILLGNGILIETKITQSQYQDLVLARESESDERVYIGEMDISGKNIRKLWKDG